MKREDLVQRIEIPTYKVGHFVLNEYELRELMVRVAKGEIENWEDLTITDNKGKLVKFRTDRKIPGTITDTLSGMELTAESTMKLFSLGAYIR